MQKRITYTIRLLFLAMTIGGALWLGSVASENPAVQNLILSGGYLGVFLFSFINGFNVVVPVITASFIPALSAAGLNSYVLVLVISVGMTIADATAFSLARAGRMHLSSAQDDVMRKVVIAEEKRRWLPLGMLTAWVLFAPLPNEVVLIPLGLMGYRMREVLPVVFVGNCIFNAVVGLGLINIFS